MTVLTFCTQKPQNQPNKPRCPGHFRLKYTTIETLIQTKIHLNTFVINCLSLGSETGKSCKLLQGTIVTHNAIKFNFHRT